MKVRIGYRRREGDAWREGDYGTVEETPTGLRFDGDAARLGRIMDELRLPGMSDAALLRSLPARLNNGYVWAREDAEETAQQ